VVTLETPGCAFGSSALDFNLMGTDHKIWSLRDCVGADGTLVMFICNHCPYVKSILDRIVRDTNELLLYNVHSVAIMSNNPSEYVEDSFDNMIKVAKKYQFSFPYLVDPTQEIAQAYGAVCTPDFFGFNAKLELQYRGRLDASQIRPAAQNVKRELFEAMVEITRTGIGPLQQMPSIGCSIKWIQSSSRGQHDI